VRVEDDTIIGRQIGSVWTEAGVKIVVEEDKTGDIYTLHRMALRRTVDQERGLKEYEIERW